MYPWPEMLNYEVGGTPLNWASKIVMIWNQYRGVGIIRKGIIRKALELSGKRWNYPEKNLPSDKIGIIRKKILKLPLSKKF